MMVVPWVVHVHNDLTLPAPPAFPILILLYTLYIQAQALSILLLTSIIQSKAQGTAPIFFLRSLFSH